MVHEEIKEGYRKIKDHIEERYILQPLIKKEEVKKGRKLTDEEMEEVLLEAKKLSKLKKAETDILRRFEGKTIEEIRKLQEVDNMNKYDRLRYAYTRVMILKDFIRVLNNRSQELEYPAIRIMSDLGIFKAEQNIGPYIILDIVSFYELLGKVDNDLKKILPKKPDYFEDLKRFRNKIVGHIDDRKELKDISDWFQEYQKIDAIGLNKIILDFEKDFGLANEILTKEEMKEKK